MCKKNGCFFYVSNCNWERVGGWSLMYKKLKYPVCYFELVMHYSAEYSLDPSLVIAIINSESGFEVNAKSVKGAVGLMQIMPATAKAIANELKYINFSEEDLYNPKLNIEFGCFYLSYLFDKFGSEDEVLFAYNAGEGTLLNYLKTSGGSFDVKVLDFPETVQYIKRVKSAKKYYTKVIKWQLVNENNFKELDKI